MNKDRQAYPAFGVEAMAACLDAIPDPIAVLDPGLRVVYANRNFEKIFLNGGQGRLCHQAMKGRDQACDSCPLAPLLRGESAETRFVEDMYPQGGVEHKALVEASVIRPGELLMITVRGLRLRPPDFDDPVTAQAWIVFEQAPCYITIHDRNFRLLEMNRRFREDFGGSPGKFCYRVYKHRNEPCLECPVMKSFEDGKPHESEEVVSSLRGESIHILTRTAPLFGPSGEIEAVMEMSTDISEIRRLQGQLADIGLLIGSISHTIKNVLSGLDSGIYLMSSGFERKRDDRIERGWEIVRRNIRRIKSTVLDILYYSKDRPLELSDMDAAQLHAEVGEMMRDKAAEHGIRWVLEADPAAGRFEGDRKALRTVLVNIVENAIDACRIDDRKDSHRIRFSCTGEDEGVIFQVSDNGLGMDRETRDKVFSLFYSTKGAQGTGLGLFMANQIVEKHGGVIHLESDYGVGTCFTIRLPRKIVPAAPD